MSRLKRFGASVLSWFKKLRRNRRLRTTLFVQPLAIMFAAFFLIFLLFNTALSYFIDVQADNAVQNQYDTLDALYVGDDVSNNHENNIFATTYIIVDEDFNTRYTSTSLSDISETAISEEIKDYVYHHEEEWGILDTENTATTPSSVVLGDATYVLEMEEYQGILDDYYVKQTTGNTQAQTYYVFVFANITPVDNLDLWINGLLLILMLVVGLFASVSIFLTSRKIDRAFGSLKGYITRVGNRQAETTPQPLPYREFNDVSDTVNDMNTLIEQNRRSQEIFFQNASHELRTPLMSIQGYAEGVKEGIIKDEKAAATVIYEESRKMSNLVDEILTLARVENAQTQLDMELLSVTDMLYDISWRMKAQADERGLVFSHDFTSDDAIIEADEDLLDRAFSNILANALRYAKHAIRLSCQIKENQLEVTISNDGTAISSHDQAHLFERFYKGNGGNFGIGLAMTKEIIDRHGGQIRVTSDDNWTVFTISLPLPK